MTAHFWQSPVGSWGWVSELNGGVVWRWVFVCVKEIYVFYFLEAQE